MIQEHTSRLDLSDMIKSRLFQFGAPLLASALIVAVLFLLSDRYNLLGSAFLPGYVLRDGSYVVLALLLNLAVCCVALLFLLTLAIKHGRTKRTS